MSRELTYLITEENIGTSPLTIHGFLKGRGYSHAVLVSLKKMASGPESTIPSLQEIVF